ncbi:hypothetical protein GCM10010492_53560 [Saccharothrix mutabilis subsp. mutabilis]|uniref:Uncharacterized protein n=1 Tax=Saccharothrix mutabilis subsp. mutabilis TaxID=66855 RepID=A0ABN0UDN6_9PSEU
MTAMVEHRTDHRERERRRHAGLGHLDSLELLDVLMGLPPQVAVPLASIRRNDLNVLRRAPGGVVRFTGSSVTRLAVPVVTPVLAVVYAEQWRAGLERASEFAAYCPRMFVVRELPADTDGLLAEASWYGVGVAVGHGDAPTMVLEPEPLDDWQPTPAWWLFCERVHRHSSAG